MPTQIFNGVIRRAAGRIAAAVIAGALCAVAATAGAGEYPERAITLIVPFAAGGGIDASARLQAQRLSEILGVPIVVENNGAAAGMAGSARVAKASPDGYTLVTSSSSMATERLLHRTLPYDAVRDFVHVVLLGTSPNVLVVPKQSGWKTVADLVAAAKTKPEGLTFASAGIGSSSHMAAERFRLAANLNARHVPFREGGLLEVMAGRIDFYFIPLAAAASALNSDKLTVLAVSSPARVPLLPNVPSIVEAGYPNAVFRFWNGLSAPAKTPPEVVQKLHDVTEQALKRPELQEKLAKLGVEAKPMSVADFHRFFLDDFAAAAQLAKDAHIEPVD